MQPICGVTHHIDDKGVPKLLNYEPPVQAQPELVGFLANPNGLSEPPPSHMDELVYQPSSFSWMNVKRCVGKIFWAMSFGTTGLISVGLAVRVGLLVSIGVTPVVTSLALVAFSYMAYRSMRNLIN